MDISEVSEGVAMSFSKRELISGATERSSLKVMTVDNLGDGSEVCEGSGCESEGSEGECEVTEAKSGEFSESGGWLITSEGSGERLGTAGGCDGFAGRPGGVANLGRRGGADPKLGT